MIGFLNGVMLKVFVTSLRRYQGPGDFILVLFASGINVLPLAGVFLLPETLVLAVIANAFHSIRLKPKLPRNSAEPQLNPIEP